MSQLLKAYDAYGDFKSKLFFTIKYNILPSTLDFTTSLVRTPKTVKELTELMDLSETEFQLVLKDWDTKDDRTARIEDDVIHEFVYAGIQNKVIISIYHWSQTLDIEFLYDAADQELENWVLEMNSRIRNKIGLSKTPTFEVLTRGKNGFDIQDVKTESITLDLDQHYNDDFKAIAERIDRSFATKKSGLILLYGKSGTGKTTYIKSLITKYEKSNFIFIQNEFVGSLLDPEFISFLLRKRNAILVIEDAEKVITSRENKSGESVVSTILQLTDGLFSDYLNIKVICTFNTSLAKIDTALLRKGRMIAKYEFDKLSLEKTNRLLAVLHAAESTEELTVGQYSQLRRSRLRGASSAEDWFLENEKSRRSGIRDNDANQGLNHL